jgi:hypothetical protein
MQPWEYVVTRPFPGSNVGSNLSSLVGALYLARKYSRTLIVDWRGLSQLDDQNTNYFTEFFEAPAAFGGTRMRYAPVPGIDYGETSPDATWLSSNDAGAAASWERANASSVVLQEYHGLDRVHPGPEAERFRLLRAFYRELAPVPGLAERVEAWAAEHLDAPFVVGLNVRTGNGHYFGRGEPYHGRIDVRLFDHRARFLRALERGCRSRLRGLPRHLRNRFQIFYATDSQPMSETLAELPHAVTRRKTFPPPGTGDTYRFDDGRETSRRSIEDTIADMFLLARCDALVYNSSMFNQYARVVTGCFGGNQVHLESLFVRGRARELANAARRRIR